MEQGVGRGALRIAQILVGDAAWGDVTLEGLATRGLGGRETAIVKLAEQWAIRGHHVECFVPVERPHAIDYPSGGRIEWIPWKAAQVYLNTGSYDALVSWEYPKAATWDGVAENIPVVLVGMQVAHIYMDAEWDQLISGYVPLSRWAGDFLIEQTSGVISWDKMWAIPNGIDLSRYEPPKIDQTRRNSRLFFYSSSPDRGLHHILRLWPRMRKELDPAAELHVAYGAERWIESAKWSHSAQGDLAIEIEWRLANTPGVVNRGSMRQDALAILQQQSALLPYTADTMQATETGCITITEAMAAGCPVVTTDCDCIPSEYGHIARIVPLPFNEDRYLETIEKVLVDPALYTGMQEAGFKLAEERQWTNTALAWLDVMTAKATKKGSSSTVTTAA